jgi:uncharacterized protein involved in type VI secretion and phage assembly
LPALLKLLTAQGRTALRQMRALDAEREQVQAQGNLRTAAPGTIFSLLDHAEHDGTDDERDRFIILSAQHRARSNLSADNQAQVNSLLGAIDAINSDCGEVNAEGSSALSNRNNRNHSKAPRLPMPHPSPTRRRAGALGWC